MAQQLRQIALSWKWFSMGLRQQGENGIFTPCRRLKGPRGPAIIVRSGSVCDDVEFLVSDIRWLAVRSGLKLIFVSLPHRRISVEDHTSIFTSLREALLGYRGAYRFVTGADTNTRLCGCSDGRLVGDAVCLSLTGLPQMDADKLAYLAEFLYEFDLRADNTCTDRVMPTRRAWISVKQSLTAAAEEELQMVSCCLRSQLTWKIVALSRVLI